MTNTAARITTPPPVRRKSKPVKLVITHEEQERPRTLGEYLRSYDAQGMYWSIGFHALLFGTFLLVLWMLDLFYIPLNGPANISVIAAVVADEEALDEPVLMSLPKLETEVAASDVSETSAVEIAKAISERSLDDARLVNVIAGGQMAKGGSGSDLAIVLPRGGNAVTKGSFTAWTVPEAPGEGEDYQIVIEIRVNPKARTYRASDLTGVVIGTDRYKQTLPYDRKRPHATRAYKRDRMISVRSSDKLSVKDGKVQLITHVPGAKRKTVDTIQLKSKRLKETQTLRLVFSSPESEGSPE